ncbi:MAG: hypothetical protein FD155_2332 [Bacteroidetes bacterium]|nr:MAG: hypothetical protein FD155_2332 [Bacteroidota bacterium]
MNIQFNWVGGATFILEIDDFRIACDPVLCPKDTIQDFFWFKSKRTEDPVFDEKTFKNIDLWLITHPHEDHLDRIGLSVIIKKSTIIANPKASAQLRKNQLSKVHTLRWNEQFCLSSNSHEIKIEAVKAVHGINPLSALFAGNVNGYVLTFSNEKETKTIYITGDTVYKEKFYQSPVFSGIDLLIPNMGGAKKGSWIMTLTLDAKMLKNLIKKLNPKHIIPVHFGTFSHYVEPVSKTEALADERIIIPEHGKKITLAL